MQGTAALLLVGLALAGTGCSPEKKVVERYTREAAVAERDDRAPDAEGLYRSAVTRARALDAARQSDALYRLGAFYRGETRYRDAVGPLEESITLANRAGGVPAIDLARRHVELAKALAALNRWPEGAASLGSAAPGIAQMTGAEADDARELVAVYRGRLEALGLDTSSLP